MLPLLIAAALLPASPPAPPAARAPLETRTWRVYIQDPIPEADGENVRFCVYWRGRRVLDGAFAAPEYALSLAAGARKLSAAGGARTQSLLAEPGGDADAKAFVFTLGQFLYYDEKFVLTNFWAYHPPASDPVMWAAELAKRDWRKSLE